jgi:hypothetical protein
MFFAEVKRLYRDPIRHQHERPSLAEIYLGNRQAAECPSWKAEEWYKAGIPLFGKWDSSFKSTNIMMVYVYGTSFWKA